MATQTSLDQVQELYIAYYDRPADTAGLNYWATALDTANGNLSSVINAFATSPESTALYGSGESASALVLALPARDHRAIKQSSRGATSQNRQCKNSVTI
jgi:hypothetical protein